MGRMIEVYIVFSDFAYRRKKLRNALALLAKAERLYETIIAQGLLSNSKTDIEGYFTISDKKIGYNYLFEGGLNLEELSML